MNQKNESRLQRHQIDELLKKLEDPAKARQFLFEAGLIDQDGNLTEPYLPHEL